MEKQFVGYPLPPSGEENPGNRKVPFSTKSRRGIAEYHGKWTGALGRTKESTDHHFCAPGDWRTRKPKSPLFDKISEGNSRPAGKMDSGPWREPKRPRTLPLPLAPAKSAPARGAFPSVSQRSVLARAAFLACSGSPRSLCRVCSRLRCRRIPFPIHFHGPGRCSLHFVAGRRAGGRPPGTYVAPSHPGACLSSN